MGTGERQGYATALAGLWAGLAWALHRLEQVAAEPAERLADHDAPETLARLQYALHSSSELVHGLEPPPGAESAHAELAAALAGARDATAEVAEALEASGPRGVDPLLLEWRGALFRVRLARMRLAATPPPAPAPLPAERELCSPGAATLATTLVLLGVLGFTAGAMLALWPVWAAGLALVVAGFAAQQRR